MHTHAVVFSYEARVAADGRLLDRFRPERPKALALGDSRVRLDTTTLLSAASAAMHKVVCHLG